jgi:hypothetical protein
MNWRRHIFESRRRYRVVADCDVPWLRVFQFRVGEVVVFYWGYHNYFDGLSIYLFRTLSGEELFWTLHDSEPDDKWKCIFERVDEIVAA